MTRLLSAIDHVLPGMVARFRPAKDGSAVAPPVQPQRYASSCKFQGRGVKPFDTKLTSAGFPEFGTLIEERLRTHGRCRVLEMGCGEGRLLLDLLARFGERVELHGLNHPEWPMIAGDSPLHVVNEYYEIIEPSRLRSLPLPTLHAGDVQALSAFPEQGFDFIISQAVLPHVPDKARALEHSARLLAPDGMFVHELDCVDLPPLDFLDTDLPRFTVYQEGVRISTRDHLRTLGVDLLSCQRTGVKGVGLLAVYRNTPAPLHTRLELDRGSTLQLRTIASCEAHLRLWGVRSVYTIAA